MELIRDALNQSLKKWRGGIVSGSFTALGRRGTLYTSPYYCEYCVFCFTVWKKAMPRAARKPAKKAASADFKNFVPYKPKKGEEYMNEKQREHFKGILLTWKSELMQEVDRTVTHMKDEAANFPDPADRATQEEEFSLELRTRDRERKLIKKIDSTIERLEQDDYGFCDACGVEIGIKRLEARPTASLCIDCKTLDEIKEKQELG